MLLKFETTYKHLLQNNRSPKVTYLNNLRRRDKWEEPELGLKGSFIISEL
jgi:hypothetical protein